MALPHNFVPGTPMGIATGTWYKLIPKSGAAGTHVITKELFLPVTDSVSFSQQHNWNESDNMGKNLIAGAEGMLSQLPGGSVMTAIVDTVSRGVQKNVIGGGPSISACAVYMDSSPPAISVKTKLFTPDGSGVVMNLLEDLRADFTGGLTTKGKGASINASIALLNDKAGKNVTSGGVIDHPEWWDIQVVSFAGGGAAVLMDMKNMIPKSMDVVMYAPFIGRDPSLVDLTIGFGHGFRGLRESMSFGGGGGGASSSSPGQPQSTPASNSRSNVAPTNSSSYQPNTITSGGLLDFATANALLH